MSDDLRGFIAVVVTIACCYALVWAMAKDGKIAMFRHDWSKALFGYSILAALITVWLFALGKGIFA